MSDYETSINKTDNTSDKAGGASAQVLPAEAGMDGGPVDKALAFAEHAGPINTDPVAMRKLLWRIDLMIMPIMMGCEFLNFLDKSSISYSALFGFKSDNHLVGQDFAWLGSIFYFGYLFWQPFAAYFLVRIPVRWHLSGAVVIWGTLLGCTASCTNFASLAVVRFLLGCAESAMVPILGSVTGMWYTRSEQATRVGIWFGSVGMSQIIGGLIAFGMYSLNTDLIEKWQFIFILMGPITVVWGLFIAWHLPSSPATARWLTDEQRLMAIERIRANKTGTAAQGIKWNQFWEAGRDPRLYLCALAVFSASVPNGGGGETVAMFIGVVLSRWTKMRGVPASICIAISVCGAAMMVGIPLVERNARYAGYVLVFFYPVGQMLMIPWLQSMIGGHTKRTTFYALYQICYAAGNIVGAQIYRAKDAPNYLPAKTVVLCFLVIHALCFLAIAGLHVFWNRRRDARDLAEGPPPVIENEEFLDKTDFEIASFRYPL